MDLKAVEAQFKKQFNDFIFANSDKINLGLLICNPNFNSDLLSLYPSKEWMENNDGSDQFIIATSLWKRISEHHMMSLEEFLSLKNTYPFDKETIIRHQKFITLDLVLLNSQFDWNYNSVIMNTNIPLNDRLIEFAKQNCDETWCRSISMRKDITLDILRKYPRENWDWKFVLLCSLKLKNIDFIQASDINSGWNLKEIMALIGGLFEDLYDRFPFETRKYCRENKIRLHYTIDFVTKNIKKNINWNMVSCYSFAYCKLMFYKEAHKVIYQNVLNELVGVFMTPENQS